MPALTFPMEYLNMAVKTFRLALIGFGTVGQGLAEILHANSEPLAANQGFRALIVAVSDLLKGALYHPDGLDIAALLKARDNLSAYPDQPGLVRGLDAMQTIARTN